MRCVPASPQERGCRPPQRVLWPGIRTASLRATPLLATVLGPVRTQKLLLGRNDFRDKTRNPGDDEEVFVGEVLVYVVAGPASAPHGEREVEAVVEATPVAVDLDLVDQQPAHVHLQADLVDVRLVGGVQPA